MLKFKQWLEGNNFPDEDIEALGFRQGLYIPFHFPEHDWHVHFVNSRKKPMEEGEFKKLVAKDKKLLIKFFETLKALQVNPTLHIPIVMRYMDDLEEHGQRRGFYHPATPDEVTDVRTKNNWLEINRLKTLRNEAIIGILLHEFGHAIFHAIEDPRILGLLQWYSDRETGKFRDGDQYQWSTIMTGVKAKREIGHIKPHSNIPSLYSMNNFYSRGGGFNRDHYMGSEWLAEVIAHLSHPDLKYPFLRVIRSQIAGLTGYRDRYYTQAAIEAERDFFRNLGRRGSTNTGQSGATTT